MPCTAILWKRRFKVLCIALCFLAEAANEKIIAQSPVHSIRTIVTPLVGEDIARPCEYDMVNPSSGKKIRGVFVVFERGPGSVRFYNDLDIRSFADKHELAMMMPRHCSSKVYEDMDINQMEKLFRQLLIWLKRASPSSARQTPLLRKRSWLLTKSSAWESSRRRTRSVSLFPSVT
jgi:hypothetical protein